LESVREHFLKSFFGQLICSVIGDVYDFCAYIPSERNLFYLRLRSLDREAAQSIYKMTAMYHTIHYLAGGTYKGEDPADMLEKIRYIFDLSESECKNFSELADSFLQSEALFEAKFAKYAAARIFGATQMSPWKLAYVNYYFLSSYQQFINTNQNYVA
jgi:hypothetical protein